MKLVVVALSLFVSLFSFAATQGVKNFQVKDALFAAEHVQVAGKATFKVDYDQSLVTMFVERKMPPCPAGKMCAAVMPEPLIVQLPIQKVENAPCGIHHITALEDQRPVDGDLKKITLEDTTDMTCRIFMAHRPKATYETSFYDRISGKEVVSTSTMEILPVENEVGAEARQAQPTETLVMTEGTFSQGFPSFQKPSTGTLTITDEEVQMDISTTMDCGAGNCPRYNPQPMMIHLPIVERKKTGCGNLLVARADSRLTDGSLQELRIVDYRNAVCRLAMGFLAKVEYTQSYESANGSVVNKATFLFNRESL